MTWIATATHETTDLSQYSSNTGTVSATTASKRNGSYGLSATVGTGNYCQFTSLGRLMRVETEINIDPNSMAGAFPIAKIQQLLTVDGTELMAAYLLKMAGQSNYQLHFLGARNYRLAGSVVTTGAWTQSISVSDAYHKLRTILTLEESPRGAPTNTLYPLYYGYLQIFVDDVFSYGQVEPAVIYERSRGGIDTFRIGSITASGASGTLYFDDVSYAISDGSLATPLVFTTRTSWRAFRARVKMNTIWVDGSPFYIVEGTTGALALILEDVSSGITSPAVTAYLDGTACTATIFPTGTVTSSGNTIVSKPLAALEGGNRYVIIFSGTVDGKTILKKLLLVVQSPGDDI